MGTQAKYNIRMDRIQTQKNKQQRPKELEKFINTKEDELQLMLNHDKERVPRVIRTVCPI